MKISELTDAKVFELIGMVQKASAAIESDSRKKKEKSRKD